MESVHFASLARDLGVLSGKHRSDASLHGPMPLVRNRGSNSRRRSSASVGQQHGRWSHDSLRLLHSLQVVVSAGRAQAGLKSETGKATSRM
ncbi:hypothetical protein NDU88_007708 [Pleurodeles waltl]|uniref:Uncharacterized protein n=1 Tax=Pleurodeles waltl TaxID=8319 RepID=A0AAV7U208_PLEWA|nr:hypothetical protein NDU88_007708 [Pleurodeles waltl]